MKLRRDADPELAAVMLFGHRFWNGLAAGLHVGHHVSHNFADAFERGLWRFCQPAQGRKLGAQAQMFVVFGGPGDPVGVVFDVHDLRRSLS